MNRSEFEVVFDHYFDDVASFLADYSTNSSELQDWVQEVFIKIYVNRESIDFEHPCFKGYLLRTARNHALNRLKSNKRYRRWLEHNLIRLTETSTYGETESLFDSSRNSFESAYNEALRRLPERALETWKLSREEGLTYPEIAKEMEISVKTVEAQISKVLQILRYELRQFQTEEGE